MRGGFEGLLGDGPVKGTGQDLPEDEPNLKGLQALGPWNITAKDAEYLQPVRIHVVSKSLACMESLLI